MGVRGDQKLPVVDVLGEIRNDRAVDEWEQQIRQRYG
jgi:hypothetical protein